MDGRRTTWTAVACLLTLALAGCAGDDDAAPEIQEPAVVQQEEVVDNVKRSVELVTNVTSGMAPLPVNFDLDAAPADDTLAWTMTFADGRFEDGTGAELPLSLEHTYAQAGDFVANFTVTFPDGNTISAEQVVRVSEPPVPVVERELPSQMEFSFGPGLGCVNDAGSCIGIDQGIGSDIDGYWVELGPLYWGLDFTSTVQNARADSDCFLLDEAGAIVGSAHNIADPCGGNVPVDVAYMYLHSYAEPHLGMTLTFSVPE